MGSLRACEWQKLPVSLKELCLDTTLRCGQSFRWRKSGEGEWSMALHGRIISLKQEDEHLHYRAMFSAETTSKKAIKTPLTPPRSQASTPSRSPAKHITHIDDTQALLKHYLNLTPNLTSLYESWSRADKNFASKAPRFAGIRILQQDAWEALVGFICSSNNNIARISQMVAKLCSNYGPLIGYLRHEDGEDVPYYDFPGPEQLVGDSIEAELRQLGFGYRARYLWQTAKIIMEKDEGLDWLESLRNPEKPLLGQTKRSAGKWSELGRQGYRDAHEALLELQGVGPKVADCVCLFGLGWGDALPVDTHVWQIAQRDYRFGKGKHSSLTRQTYDAVGNKFRSLWGEEAGWAHSVLFTADLAAFSERLTAKIEKVEETQTIKKEENGEEVIVDTVKVDTVKQKKVKREFEEEEHPVIQVEQSVRRTKRRR